MSNKRKEGDGKSDDLKRPPVKGNVDRESWYEEIRHIAKIIGHRPEDIRQIVTADEWQEHFDDGYTPAEAWLEQLSYG